MKTYYYQGYLFYEGQAIIDSDENTETVIVVRPASDTDERRAKAISLDLFGFPTTDEDAEAIMQHIAEDGEYGTYISSYDCLYVPSTTTINH